MDAALRQGLYKMLLAVGRRISLPKKETKLICNCVRTQVAQYLTISAGSLFDSLLSNNRIEDSFYKL